MRRSWLIDAGFPTRLGLNGGNGYSFSILYDRGRHPCISSRILFCSVNC